MEAHHHNSAVRRMRYYERTYGHVCSVKSTIIAFRTTQTTTTTFTKDRPPTTDNDDNEWPKSEQIHYALEIFMLSAKGKTIRRMCGTHISVFVVGCVVCGYFSLCYQLMKFTARIFAVPVARTANERHSSLMMILCHLIAWSRPENRRSRAAVAVVTIPPLLSLARSH